jgi:hypothetical protein
MGSRWFALVGLALAIGCGGNPKPATTPPGTQTQSGVQPGPTGSDQAAEKPEEKKPPAEVEVIAHDNPAKGAVQVMCARKNPVNWFDVLQDGKRAFPGNPPLLNTTLELPPGTYEVDVNRTRRTVKVEVGKKTVLWTGDLLVEGKPDTDFYAPYEGGEQKTVSNYPLLNRPHSLFPGSYTVWVFSGLGKKTKVADNAVVTAGRTTIIQK